jgi:hypothetical protein
LIIGLVISLFGACAPGASVQSGNVKVQEGKGNGIGHASKTAERSPTPETAGNPATVETRLTELFDICKSGKAEDAASYFVYRGPDEKRKWKDTLRADDPLEKAALEEGCREIKNLLDGSQGYVLGEVKVERESEGEWNALEVSFQQGEKTKKLIFAFLLVKGQFAVGDIDQ